LGHQRVRILTISLAVLYDNSTEREKTAGELTTDRQVSTDIMDCTMCTHIALLDEMDNNVIM